jgi:hypothetical protein
MIDCIAPHRVDHVLNPGRCNDDDDVCRHRAGGATPCGPLFFQKDFLLSLEGKNFVINFPDSGRDSARVGGEATPGL